VPPVSEQSRWFAEEVLPHEPQLRGFLRSRFPALTDLDDLVQESYARLLRAREAGKVSNIKSYLFATARNAALDWFRRRQIVSFERITETRELSVLEESDVAGAADHDDELEILTAAIRALPERCREVLVLRKHHGLSHREIAEKLGISPNTVNAQITLGMMRCREYFRARGLLRETPHELQPTPDAR
jgi:RNA polymerase sigma factor (sigma-70 family)